MYDRISECKNVPAINFVGTLHCALRICQIFAILMVNKDNSSLTYKQYMSGFVKLVLKNWTPNRDFNLLLGVL